MADEYNSGRRDPYRTQPSNLSPSMRSVSGHQIPDSYLECTSYPSYSHYTPGPEFTPCTFSYNNHTLTSPNYIDPRSQLNVHSSIDTSYNQSPYPSLSPPNYNYATRNDHPNIEYQSSAAAGLHSAILSNAIPVQSHYLTDHHCSAPLPSPRVGPSTGVVRNHICPTCGKGFGRPSSLAQHEFTHTGERPYVCSVCTKAFNTSSNLKRHQGLHEAA
ncbi:hypothetical protein CROQUDRAFT_662683 [Cronartium quercuum f. sp. fusiforme G11]|uniref:C2H2-type domain-containing protein n=1 Tax=Cronartium quercuum f. sp. fusiforme G11 TaxID=708437 RepID=A0A9P6NAE8_9BASI|nr:hypothetical protein CROQUDRAFT_662683 [Cronartium quercuum f. sp. fusiforme G11]